MDTFNTKDASISKLQTITSHNKSSNNSQDNIVIKNNSSLLTFQASDLLGNVSLSDIHELQVNIYIPYLGLNCLFNFEKFSNFLKFPP